MPSAMAVSLITMALRASSWRHEHQPASSRRPSDQIETHVIAPFVSAPGNANESPLLRKALPLVSRLAIAVGLDLQGTIVSLDGVYDCRTNRKAIFNRGMVPNINANPRGRRSSKRGRKPLFNSAIFKERFNPIERVFGWEDKFRRLLLRFDRLSRLHYAFKALAYTMIHLPHFCQD